MKVLIIPAALFAGIWAYMVRQQIVLMFEGWKLRRRRVEWHVRSRLNGHWKIYYITDGVVAEEFGRINRLDHGNDDYDAVCIGMHAAAENEAIERNIEEMPAMR